MSNTETIPEMPETKRRLLDAATQLMLRQGFTATTVDEICAEADLTKGSFFHYFKSKEDIGEGALDHFCARQREQFAAAPFNRLADPLERIHGMLDFIGQMAGQRSRNQGCLLGNFTQELALTNPRIRSACEQKLAGMAANFAAQLREAKAKHCPRATFDPDSVATLFVTVLEGSMLVAKARQDVAVMKDNLEHFRQYLGTLFTVGGRH